jgi:hypothetical protein
VKTFSDLYYVIKLKNMNLSIKELNELIYSLGITASKGIMCDKDLNVSLLNKLYDELNSKIAEEAIDEEVESSTYYVSNEDDLHMLASFPITNPFTSVSDDYDNHLNKLKQRGYITQTLLDYVDRNGAVSHGELESYYKSITGSNSFSHILANLRIPYKNRETKRYISKEGRKGSNAKWVVKVANPSNWVVIEY